MHPPRVQTRTPRPPPHTTSVQVHPPKMPARLAMPVPRSGAWAKLPLNQALEGPCAPSTPAPGPPGMCRGLRHGAALGLGLPSRDPPACCAWMSLPYTASADSISVRLVWIIWREGWREELGSPQPHASPSRAGGEKGLRQGLPLAPARQPGSGPPRLATGSQVRCDQRLAGAQVPLQHKGRKRLRLWLLMGFLPPGGTAGYPASRPWHRVQAAWAGGQRLRGLVPSWASLRLNRSPPWAAPHAAPCQLPPALA